MKCSYLKKNAFLRKFPMLFAKKNSQIKVNHLKTWNICKRRQKNTIFVVVCLCVSIMCLLLI